ncbi:GNAT family N-acetyltransferase [Rhizobiaceae sp. 2RAB30]
MIHWQADFISALHIADAGRRRGIGRLLLSHAEAAIAAAGHRQARLETDTFKTGAVAFYSALGYREAARYPDEEWDSGLTTLLMKKSLPD